MTVTESLAEGRRPQPHRLWVLEGQRGKQRRKRGKGKEEKTDCKKEREEEEGMREEDKSQRPGVRGVLSSGTSLPR